MGVTGLESVGLTCLAIMSEKIYAIAGGLSLIGGGKGDGIIFETFESVLCLDTPRECSVFAQSRLQNAVCRSVVHVVAPPGSEFVRRVTPPPRQIRGTYSAAIAPLHPALHNTDRGRYRDPAIDRSSHGSSTSDKPPDSGL